MNIWPYIGLFFVLSIGFLLFTLVMVWIFVCVDNYYADKMEENLEVKATCDGCKYFCDDETGTSCILGVNESTLRSFNHKNIRPCYCKEEKDGKNH